MVRVLLFNKPFDVLSQFTDQQQRATLSRYIHDKSVRVAGRLDRDSEGLLVLTDSGALQSRLTHPKHKLSKTYWVQVEGQPSEQDLQPLRDGIELKDGRCRPAKCQTINEPYLLWQRTPPIRTRITVPDTWLSLTITEGKNRQVRRMCAALGFPALRLIRYRVGSWTLDGIEPGTYKQLLK
ncbi:MAG: pseudouridine synthase [Gammaproteobacteria bacterium]|nr:pseudouridine synthase [Gammaproteobacteria bacterium]